MAGLKWTKQALADLEAVHDFIARDAEAYAEMLTESLYEQAARLAEEPTLGDRLPLHKDGDVREVMHGAYRIIYRLRDETVYILAVCIGGHVGAPAA